MSAPPSQHRLPSSPLPSPPLSPEIEPNAQSQRLSQSLSLEHHTQTQPHAQPPPPLPPFPPSQIQSHQPPSPSPSHASPLQRRTHPSPPTDDESQPWNGPIGWSLYFPNTAETDNNCGGHAVVVQRLVDFFLSSAGRDILSSLPVNSYALPFDFRRLTAPSAHGALRSLAAALPNDPGSALASLGLAACRAAERLEYSTPNLMSHLPDPNDGPQACLVARIRNFHPLTALRSLKSTSVDTFVAVRGTVVRVSTIRQQLVSMHFQCGGCKEVQVFTFKDYQYSVPSSCPTDKCRSRHFAPLRKSAHTVDWQRIRIQELQQRGDDAASIEEGRIPRTIDAELFSDLIDSCVPGDIATVCGIVKVITIDAAGGGGGGGGASRNSKSLYYMYIEANSLQTMRNRVSSSGEATTGDSGINANARGVMGESIDASQVHHVIHQIVCEKDPFGFLVHSAVPSIFGHEMVKAGLLLALFGGASRNDARRDATISRDRINIRRDIHCLIVGDPGLGKSQMLKALCNIAPRGVYVCGNTASTAGLTVTVVRDASGDFALEAGALVLGDGGVCCIDEFDKMGSEHGALLEAMEQQSVSIAKAGLLCNLSARTTVLAAANPARGHYDRSKTVCENLKISAPLLSRFDLVYILMDEADAERDRFISNHVMRMFGARRAGGSLGTTSGQRRRGGGYRGGGGGWRRGDGEEYEDGGVVTAAAEAAAATQARAMAEDGLVIRGLEDRLKRLKKDVTDPLPPRLFREYVAYARTHVHPSLSEGAKGVLQKFYLELRKAKHEEKADTTPVTTRQLESMIRLAEARARSVMRTVVTAGDARDVVEIMRECMVAEVTDGIGGVDFGRTTGMSKSKEGMALMRKLSALSRKEGKKEFTYREMKRVAMDIGIPSQNVGRVVSSTNQQGLILQVKGGKYKLQALD